LGCQHYKRNVKLQCADCARWYTCRFCHDEREDHALNRRKTKNMLCMVCSFPQPAGAQCQQCNTTAAYYYCEICKLWDDDNEKSIYHCDDCGICRVGQGLGKDFYHCKTCGVCMSIAIADSHRCIERSTDCNCPICGEYMFTSPHTVVFMKCGHSIHHKCFYEHMKTSYRCPICNRSVVNMEIQFRNLDRAIEEQPMPPQFRDTQAVVSCNDCSAKTIVPYHWLGLKC
ncbi:zf-CHY-domain-containing protein, partial [Xylona heveae TC161]